jgi:hypothetical protein
MRVPAGAQEAWPNAHFHVFNRTSDSLASALIESGAETVALHYVPHGYHPRGMPSWLPLGLAEWKKQRPNGRLVVFFHELFAFLPPWRTAFWCAPKSIAIMRQVIRLSDASMTSIDLYERQLRVYGGLRGPIEVIPISSNIPAIARAEAPSAGPWRVGVFGIAGTRASALRQLTPFLRALSEGGQLAGISIIGAHGNGEDVRLAEQFATPTVVTDASEPEVSRALASTHLGLVATDEPRYAKSGVFAAYIEHGMLPVLIGRRDGPYLPVRENNPRSAMRMLADPAALAAMRERTSRHELACSWKSVAARWSAVVAGTGTSSS